MVTNKGDQSVVMAEFHESPCSGYRGTWGTFEKLQERYWWPGMYKDVYPFVMMCENSQMQSAIRHRDDLHPSYPSTIHFKWMVHLMKMPMGVGQMRYLELARKDLTNQLEGQSLKNKMTATMCRFLLEDVIYWYGCMGKIVANRGELDAQEAEELFDRLGVNLSLMKSYNLEANGKVGRGHGSIVKAIMHACDARVGNWPRFAALCALGRRNYA